MTRPPTRMRNANRFKLGLFADRLPEARAAIERVGVFVRSHAP